jgi:hypothetical protein
MIAGEKDAGTIKDNSKEGVGFSNIFLYEKIRQYSPTAGHWTACRKDVPVETPGLVLLVVLPKLPGTTRPFACQQLSSVLLCL